MFTHSPQHSHSGLRRALLALLAVAPAAIVLSTLVPARGASAAPGGYHWPVKPFDQAHPIRANFGDPRTTFNGPPTPGALMSSGGIFQFHFGVDIAVPDGTPVYPVRSGVATLRSGRTVSVDSGGGFVAEYWHIVPTITPGQHVTAYQTVLGHVMKGYEHVHFTELDHGRPVNPLAPGHLAPYTEGAAPSVASISFRTSDTGPELLPEFVHGRVVLVAQVSDRPALPVPGMWANLPVAPALLTWRIERASDHRVVVPERTAFDVRTTLPQDPFWSRYARGTRQNMSTFNGQRAWREPGVYLYRLGASSFDTAGLANGIYELVVTAGDIRGNTSSTRQVFIVRNA
jgi:Peptidase family M23